MHRKSRVEEPFVVIHSVSCMHDCLAYRVQGYIKDGRLQERIISENELLEDKDLDFMLRSVQSSGMAQVNVGGTGTDGNPWRADDGCD